MAEYCLILAGPETENSKAAAFMISALGLERNEAELRLKASPGFLIENTGLETATKASARAAAAGLKTLVIESPSLSLLPRPFNIEKIEFKSDGFYYQNKVQRMFVTYSSLRMVTAAAIEVFLPPKTPAPAETDLIEEIRLKYFPSIFKPENNSPRTAPAPQPQKELAFYADIFTSAGDFPRPALLEQSSGREKYGPGFKPRLLDQKGGARLRFKHDEFDFSGLGSVKTYSSAENFRLLLGELEARAATKPLMNRAFGAIRRRVPVRDFILPALEAYEKELLWLTCLV